MKVSESFIFVSCVLSAVICVPSNVADNVNEDDAPIKYDGAQLWRIPLDRENSKQIVSELQENFDASEWNTHESTVDLLLRSKSIIDARQLLTKANISYSILIEDLQKDIENENPPKEQIEMLQNRKAKYFRYWPEMQIPEYEKSEMSGRNLLRIKGAFLGYNSLDPPMELWPDAKWGHRMTWSAYHRMADIVGYLEYLAKTYPDLCSVQEIGKSFEGRPLTVLRISNGNENNRAIWIDGGIHAREWISPAAVTYVINQLIEDWENQPSYIQNIDWYILPLANPDGYEYSHTNDRLWRKNRGGVGRGRCAGVDLNRNFGYKWGLQGASDRPCSEIFAGSKAFSEPETVAQKMFMARSAANFEAFLTFHSYGQYILYPWGYDTVVPPDYMDLDRVGKEAANKMKGISGLSYSVGPSGSLLYPAAGASDDWAKSIGIKYAYTVELRDTGRYGFILPALKKPEKRLCHLSKLLLVPYKISRTNETNKMHTKNRKNIQKPKRPLESRPNSQYDQFVIDGLYRSLPNRIANMKTPFRW